MLKRTFGQMNFSKEFLDDLQEFGRYYNADTALIIDGNVSRLYKKGDVSTKRFLYFMHVDENLPNTWSNSFEINAARVANFYRNLGKDVHLIEINNGEAKIEN